MSLETSEKRFTLEELKQYDGKEGRRAYVVVKGKVYDVTDSYLWIDGNHQSEHNSGMDLTEELARAPHGEEELSNVKFVGLLVESK